MHDDQAAIDVYLVAPPLVRWGLERLLQAASPQICLSGSSSSLDEAADDIESQFPDVVVIYMDDASPQSVQNLRDRASVKMISLESAHPGSIQPSLDDGGFVARLDTRTTPSNFVRTILGVAHGGMMHSERPAAPRRQFVHATRSSETFSSCVEPLTPKQQEVVRAIADYASAPVKVIADKLHMSERTLRNHLTTVYSKLGVTRRTHLQAFVANQPALF
jgi:two-component system nitrate/nitrite response regulator NarL